MKDLITLFSEFLNNCHKCGNSRKEMMYCELPEDIQEVFKDAGPGFLYLYCEKCEDFSVMIDFDNEPLN